MRLGCTRTLALSVGLLTLLAACQSGPNPRGFARTNYAPDYRDCSYDPCGRGFSRPQCPPGYILGRVPFSYGGPGRYCEPYYGRWHRCYGPRPCDSGRRYAGGYY